MCYIVTQARPSEGMSPRVGRGDLIVRAKQGFSPFPHVKAYLANTEKSLERGCPDLLKVRQLAARMPGKQ